MKGTTLGPYRLLFELGSGGMGTVHVAEAAADGPAGPRGTRVAVKVVHPRLLSSPGVVARFRREAAVGRTVRHPNVVRTLDVGVGTLEGRPAHFLVMELVEGQTLRTLLREAGRLPEELCRHAGRGMAAGLRAIHAAGVVHRDLKPDNVLVAADHAIKIMDLGVARLREEATRLTRTGAFVGSLHYAAPEQLRETAGGIDGRTDLYALGVTLFELATGRHPFGEGDIGTVLHRILVEGAPRASSFHPQLTPFLEELIHRLLAREPQDRIANAGEVGRILGEGEEGGWWRRVSGEVRRETRRPLRRVRIARETGLHGRDREMALLEDLFREAAAGRGRAVLLEGEAGIGKTRLADELERRLEGREDRPLVLFGAYPPGGAAPAAGAFGAAFREHFGPEGLEEILRARLPETPAVVPALAALLRGDALPRGSGPSAFDALPAAVVNLARSLAREGPTVLVVDDLSSAPEGGRALFALLAAAAAEMPLLLVGTLRSGREEAWAAELSRMEHLVRVPLGRLPPRDLSRLLADALRSGRLAAEVEDRVVAGSGGNPYSVFEILRGLRKDGVITEAGDGTWVKTRVLHDLPMPDSLTDHLRARIAALEEGDREILEAASCCGNDFDPLLVGEVLEIPPVPLLRRLGILERRTRLVRSVGIRFAFDHPQVRETLYASVSGLLRREYHGALAAALEARARGAGGDPGDAVGETAAALCDHHLRSGRPRGALPYLEPALDHLEGLGLHDAAVALADRAESVPGLLTGEGRLEVLIRKAGRLEDLGLWEDERRTLARALDLADGIGEPRARARVRRRMGRHYGRTARPREAERALREAVDLFREAGDGPGERASAGDLGVVCWGLGRIREAAGHLGRTLDPSGRAGDSRASSVAAATLAEVLRTVGRFGEARDLAADLLAAARGRGDRRAEAAAESALGSLDLDLGEFEEARAAFLRAREAAASSRDRRGEARAAAGLAAVAESLGDLAEARDLAAVHAEASREVGDWREETRGMIARGRALVLLGDAGRGGALLEAAADQAAEVGGRALRGAAAAALAEAAEEAGNAAGADRFRERALRDLRGSSLPRLAAATMAALGAARAAGGDGSGVRLLAEARGLAESLRDRGTAVLADALLSLHHGRDPAGPARALGEGGRGIPVLVLLRVHLALARRTGEADHRAAAGRILAGILERVPGDRRERMVAGVALFRAVREGSPVR